MPVVDQVLDLQTVEPQSFPATRIIDCVLRPSVGSDAFYTWFVEPSLRHFKRIGAFSEAEADAFLADLFVELRVETAAAARSGDRARSGGAHVRMLTASRTA